MLTKLADQRNARYLAGASHQFCMLLEETCLLAVFPVDAPTEWVFVLGRPEMRECVPISHTPNWRRQERRKWRYRFRWVRAFLHNQSTGIRPLPPRNEAAEYDLWCTSPSPAWFNPCERIVSPCDPWVLRYPLRMKPVLVVGGTHPEHSCREREVIILGEADGFIKWVPGGQ